MIETIRYRAGQFLRTLAARAPEEEIERAIRTLTPEAQALFRRQAMQDQRHALAVYRARCEAGHTNPHLLAAALLHDAGKAAARLSVWHRTIIVLLGRFAPRLLERLGRGEPKGWREPFVAYARHPEVGARWAQEADCSPLTVTLIRRHQERPARLQAGEDELLAALQAADSQD